MRLGETDYAEAYSLRDKAFRQLFQIIWQLSGLVFPGRIFRKGKLCIINAFGGRCHPESVVYATAKIFNPSNLVLKKHATIGPHTIIYNVDVITINEGSIVSQYAHINTASHDYKNKSFPLVHKPVSIGKNCWIAADAFIGMGVHIPDDTVVGARSSVFKPLKQSGVYVGNPAKKLPR